LADNALGFVKQLVTVILSSDFATFCMFQLKTAADDPNKEIYEEIMTPCCFKHIKLYGDSHKYFKLTVM
jgi:hypothetical protein